MYAVGEKVSCCRYYDTVGRVPNTSETELPDPMLSFLATYAEETKPVSRSDVCCLVFTAASLTVAKTWKPAGVCDGEMH